MYKEIDYNKKITWVVVLGFVFLLVLVIYFFGEISNLGYFGIVLGLMISMPSALIGYFAGDSVVLYLAGAKQISKKDDPRLFGIVENIAITAGLPVPKVFVIQDNSMNAFATGRDPHHASIAITSGLLNILEKSELEGVIAHEFSHIKNFDIRLSMVLVVFVGLIVALSDIIWRIGLGGSGSRKKGGSLIFIIGLIFIIVSPFVARFLQMFLSRKREYLADAEAALLTRYPEGLASALEKLSAQEKMLSNVNNALNHLYIVSPIDNVEGRKKSSWFSGLFMTHPPIKDRIVKLRSMSV
ncbi:MAG: M48 family metallopeptidase [Patescibacteria group bacterium]